jgi:CheY-like chemotaxis protein
MRPQPVVLLACSPAEVGVLEAYVPRKAQVVTAVSMDGAIERMTQGVDAIVCSMQFDESRMLELVQEAHQRRPDIPVLCCRVFGSRMSEVSLRAAAAAAFSVGVAGFLDLADYVPVLGADAAELGTMLLRLLGLAAG